MKTNKLLLIGLGAVLLIAGFLLIPEKTSLVGGGDNTQFGASSVRTAGSSLTATTTQILASKTGRRYAMITNTSDTLFYLAFSTSTSVTAASTTPESSFVVPVPANGGTYIIDSDNLYTGYIYATGTAAKTYRTLEVY